MPLAPSPAVLPRKKLLRLVSLSALVALIFLMALEISLRVFLGLGHPVLIAPDAACGYIVKPDQNLVRFFVHTRINRYGMRSDDLPAHRDPHALRILFVGDSITYGTTRVDQDQIFTHRVQKALPSILHRPVEVLNASANGWAPDNEVAYVRSRGTFQSDAVVLVLNSGDLTEPRAAISQAAGGLETKAPPFALDEIWQHFIKPILDRHLFHRAAKIDPGDSAVEGADEVVRENLSELTALQSLVTGQHARLIVVYIPFRNEIPLISGRYLAILRSWAGGHQVPLIDLTAVEAAHSSQEINILGAHLSAYGNLLIANALDRTLPSLLPQ